MEAKDLTIGDYVVFNDTPYIVQEISAKGWIHLVDAKNHLRTQMSTDYIIEQIQGIPLTSEILEKNGFTKRKDGPWAIEKKRIVGCCGQTCDNTNPLVYVIWVDKGYMGVVNYQPEATITKAGSYVHELQQCIRLCGIDKEITL